jgi:hypothetical protein
MDEIFEPKLFSNIRNIRNGRVVRFSTPVDLRRYENWEDNDFSKVSIKKKYFKNIREYP